MKNHEKSIFIKKLPLLFPESKKIKFFKNFPNYKKTQRINKTLLKLKNVKRLFLTNCIKESVIF